MYCRKCGGQVNDDDKFCSVCGTQVENVESISNNVDSVQIKETKQKSKKIIIMSIVASAILTLVLFLRMMVDLDSLEMYVESVAYEDIFAGISATSILGLLLISVAFYIAVATLVLSIIALTKRSPKILKLVSIFGIVLVVLTSVYFMLEIFVLVQILILASSYPNSFSFSWDAIVNSLMLDVIFVVSSILTLIGSRKQAKQ